MIDPREQDTDATIADAAHVRAIAGLDDRPVLQVDRMVAPRGEG